MTALITASDAAREQADAEAKLAAIRTGATVTSDEDYTAADAILTDLVRRKDAVKAMQDRGVKPLEAGVKEIKGWFRPTLKALEDAETFVKGQLSAFMSAKADRERAARAALVAAPEPAAAVAALAVLDAPKVEARATVTWRWVVKRIDAARLARTYLIPDERAIGAIARAAGSGEIAPVVEGVEFERVAQIGAKR